MGININNKLMALISIISYSIAILILLSLVFIAARVSQLIKYSIFLPDDWFTNKNVYLLFLSFMVNFVFFYIGFFATNSFFKIGHYYYLKMQEVKNDIKNPD